MDLSLEHEIAGTPDLRHRVRHLKWFRRSFHRCAALMQAHFGMPIEIDDRRLCAAFLNWAELFEAQKPYGRTAPRDFSVFAGGLMLQELLRHKFADVHPPRRGHELVPYADVVAVWPVGILASSYCVSVLNAVAAQDFAAPFRLSPEAYDRRMWASFRENSREDPSRAIGFLDLIVGNSPHWTQPGFAPARPAFRTALASDHASAPRLIH